MVAPSAGGSRLPWQRTPTTNPFLTNSKKIRRSKRATNTHEHGPGSYLSDGTRGDSQSHAERDPLRSKDRALFTYNIDYNENDVTLRRPWMNQTVVLQYNVILSILIICLFQLVARTGSYLLHRSAPALLTRSIICSKPVVISAV